MTAILGAKNDKYGALAHLAVKNVNYYDKKRGFFNCWMRKRKHVNGEIAMEKCVAQTGFLEKSDVCILNTHVKLVLIHTCANPVVSRAGGYDT